MIFIFLNIKNDYKKSLTFKTRAFEYKKRFKKRET